MKYIQPEVLASSYTCPHCGVISKQEWWLRNWDDIKYQFSSQNPLRVGICDHCHIPTLWVVEKMYYPDTGNSPFPNPEMPESVLKLYLESSNLCWSFFIFVTFAVLLNLFQN